jgi:hypothetical protein
MFFKSTVIVRVLPTDSFPKFKTVGLTRSTLVAVTPVPLIVKVSVLLTAVLVMDAEAATEPVEVGAKTSVQLTVLPGPRTCGVVRPSSLNPALLTEEEEMVTFEVPVFFSWIVCELLIPTGTLAKLALLGVATSVSVAARALGTMMAAPTSIATVTIGTVIALAQISVRKKRMVRFKNDDSNA